jgi:hypothetical protein
MPELNAHLSPPWYTLHHKLSAALTADKEVQVAPLMPGPGPLEIRVTCANPAKARGLVYFLTPVQQFGNVSVNVKVYDGAGAQAEMPVLPEHTRAVPDLFLATFKGNALVKGLETRPLLPGRPDSLFPIIAAEVIQFYNDNLTDFNGNANLVAADVFRDILRQLGSAGPYPSTEKLG